MSDELKKRYKDYGLCCLCGGLRQHNYIKNDVLYSSQVNQPNLNMHWQDIKCQQRFVSMFHSSVICKLLAIRRFVVTGK